VASSGIEENSTFIAVERARLPLVDERAVEKG